MSGPGPCGLCDQDPALGFASVYSGGVETWYCHDHPDWQVGDPIPTDATCYEQACHDLAKRNAAALSTVHECERAFLTSLVGSEDVLAEIDRAEAKRRGQP